jgi:hypothetical protein
MEQDILTGLQLIIKARERRDENWQRQLYCSIYPNFTKETFIPFDQFYKKQTIKVSRKSKEQIKAEKNKLDKLFAKG